MKTFLWVAIILLGGTITAIAVIFIDGLNQGFTVSEIVNVAPTNSVQNITENPDDKKYREEIASSYCNVLRKKGEIKIEGYSECVAQHISHPLEIYRAFTQESITQAWSQLSISEKQLVASEVKEAEQVIYSNMANQEMVDSMNQARKEMDDYLECLTETNKEASAWLDAQCPTVDNFLPSISCRMEAQASAEYKNLFGCKSPY